MAEGSVLGHGGMATVYLAADLQLERSVAIKVLRPELQAAVGPGRFLREIRIAAQLAHPNILPVLDSGQAAGQLYYVMLYVEGETLRDDEAGPVGDLRRTGAQPVRGAEGEGGELGGTLGFSGSP